MPQDQIEELERIKALLEERMVSKPRRYAHSLGVASCAASLAKTYGVDQFDAAAAGLLHDWDKVLDDHELLVRAAHMGIEVAGSPSMAVGLLHGPVAARELPELFPALNPSVFQAIARHTVGAVDMTPLDMVVFIADAIEPGRRGDYAIRLREMVGEASLDELFFQCFSQGLSYVISTGRYMYPTAITIYNHYACARSRRKAAMSDQIANQDVEKTEGDGQVVNESYTARPERAAASLSSAGIDARAVAEVAAQAAYDKNGDDIQVLDLTELSDVCDYFVIATGSNTRLVDSIVDEIEEQVAMKCDEHPFSIEGRDERSWILMDYGSVVVHVFTPEAHDYYRLEKLWGDAPVLDLVLD